MPILKPLHHSIKSYIHIFLVGILVGCICRLLDYCPADTLWSFSSPQTLLGFWIITNTIIVLLSTSNICAGISSFLYMFGMTLSFYGLKAILEMFTPGFSEPFRTSLFVMFTLLSILYALPIGALVSEAIAISIYFFEHHTFLFQLLMDIIGAIVFLFMFYKRAKSKALYLTALLISSAVFYFVLYGLPQGKLFPIYIVGACLSFVLLIFVVSKKDR